MRYFANPTANSPLKGKWTWILILTFTGAPTVALDQQQPLAVAGFYPPIPCPSDGAGHLKPWEQIDTTGSISLLVGEPGDRIPQGASSSASIAKLYDSNNNPIATLNNNILVGLRGEGNETLAKLLGAAAPTGAVQVGGKDGAGNLQPLPVVADFDASNPGFGLPLAAIDKAVNRPRLLNCDTFGRLHLSSYNSQAFDVVSPAAPGTSLGAAITLYGDYFFPKRATFFFESGGATGGTLDIYIQTSGDLTASWVDVIHLPQIAAGAPVARWAVVLDGSSPGGVPLAGLNTVDGTPTLAVNTTRNLLGSRWRMVLVAGAGTSAGFNSVKAHVFFNS